MGAGNYPEGFVWGSATAAHQVEGGNWNSDWWAWEHDPSSPCVEPSGDACDHYHRFEDDLDLVRSLNLDAFRFSLEWARIEPEDGEFSRAALEHYRRVIDACRNRGIRPVVTFQHFTLPRWVAAAGGWERAATADLFARYCDRAAAHLGDLIEFVCTVNEPNIVSRFGYEVGSFPPGKTVPGARDRANETFVAAHRKARDAIKSHADVPVGLTLAMSAYEAVEGGEELLEELRTRDERLFLDAGKDDDFFGVQTYTRVRVGAAGELGPEEGAETTLMGYEFYPEALEATIRRAWQMTDGTPVLVTENGIGTDNDERRIAYVGRALKGVQRCLDEGVDVRGYIYWSLLDNFEWAYGYRPTFGLVAVDRETFERRPKPSAAWFARVAGDHGDEP